MNIDPLPIAFAHAQEIIRAKFPTARLRFDPADDESVDDGATVIIDGAETEITFQFGYRYVCVNEWLPSEGAMRHYYSGADIAAAARVAVEILDSKKG